MTARYIDYAGYTDCVEITDGQTRVVLGPHSGGRVLSYALQGQEALWLSPEHDGLTRETCGDPPPLLFPSGGRCDIGPEQIVAPRPELWLGAWKPMIVDENTACMVSPESPTAGVQLRRSFTLGGGNARLIFTQSVRNTADREIRLCHWSRTFGRGHGICIVPLTPAQSRYPNQYVMYGPGRAIQCAPVDPAISRVGDHLVVYDTPANPKLGLDSYAGWFAYLMPGNQLLVKQYDTYTDRVYNEVAGLTISLWYYQDLVCELEPIGPKEVLQPGEESLFTETWYLAEYPFPTDRRALDVDALSAFITKKLLP